MTSAQELLQSGIDVLGQHISDLDISIPEVVQAVEARMATVEPSINAFISVDLEGAMARAEALQAELDAGHHRGPLHGIPYAAKDVFYTRSGPTTAGSSLLRNHRRDTESTVTQRLLDSGAILVGKTNMHEFHAGATNENVHYGACKNPHDTQRISGGSSGGSASAVAAGIIPFSIGTDTGGSIRIPSALCGVTGLKPSFGVVSRFGIIPESWSTDHCGPIARRSADLATVLSVIGGHDPNDPTTDPHWDPGSPTDSNLHDLSGIRVGVASDASLGLVDEHVRAGRDELVRIFDHLGAVAVEVDLPDLDLVSDVLQTIIWSEAASFHRSWLKDKPEFYSPEVRSKFEAGLSISAVDYIQAQKVREHITRQMEQIYEQVEFVVCPTVPVVAPRPDEEIRVGGRALPTERTLARTTPIANLTGQPAISIPTGLNPGGLPVGTMVMSKPMTDTRLLAVAGLLEGALPSNRTDRNGEAR